MFIANKTNGIGEITSQTETTTTVYFEETDKTSVLLNQYLPTIYTTYEEAEAALNPEMSSEEKETLYNEMQVEAAQAKENAGASQWLAEKNRENAMRNLPSSLK